MGDVVLLELLKSRERLPKFDAALDVFCLVDDETLRADSLKLIEELRCAGLAVDYPLGPAKPDKQFKRAQELKATHSIRLERNQNGELAARIRNLQTRNERTIPPGEAAQHLSQPSGGSEST